MLMRIDKWQAGWPSHADRAASLLLANLFGSLAHERHHGRHRSCARSHGRHGPGTRRLLHGPIVPEPLLLAWPNVLVMTAQASTGLIEGWWVSRLGIDALTRMALVFPGFMMMIVLTAGAVGGGISSAIARALGGGRRDDVDARVLHAVLINVAIGLITSGLVLGFGRQVYDAVGGQGRSLDAALA